MTSLYLPIVSRSVGSYELMFDSEFIEKFIYDVDFALSRSFGICKLRSVIGLNDFRYIAEVNERPLDEVYRRESAMFFIRINKAFSCSLIYHRILE